MQEKQSVTLNCSCDLSGNMAGMNNEQEASLILSQVSYSLWHSLRRGSSCGSALAAGPVSGLKLVIRSDEQVCNGR